jgi:hypothetical protein
MPASVASATVAIPVESTAVRAAIASMKSAITAKAFTTMESTVAAEAFVRKPASVAIAIITTTVKTPAVVAPSVVAAAIEAWPAIKSWPVVAMEPWARSDKNSSDEPIGAVVAVGRAAVRIIIIVAISTDWRRPYVRWSHANADKDSLCVGERRRT